MESGTEQDAGTGEVDQVAGGEMGGEIDGNRPGARDRQERRSVPGFHGLWESRNNLVDVFRQSG